MMTDIKEQLRIERNKLLYELLKNASLEKDLFGNDYILNCVKQFSIWGL